MPYLESRAGDAAGEPRAALAGQRRSPSRGGRRHTGRGRQPARAASSSTPVEPVRAGRRPGRAGARAGARSSSSTSTPRRRARRSRWRGCLDGRVTAVIGTHTHVQTNDARVQPGGTAAITDAGMTGPHDSVIGVKAELAIRRMRTGMPVRFEPAERRRPDRGRARRVRRRGPALSCEAVRVARPARQHGEKRDEHDVAREHDPRRERVEVEHEVPVADREPELGEDEREPEQRGSGEPAAAADERRRAAAARS